MKTAFRTIAAVALLASFGAVAQAQSHYVGRGTSVPPSTSHTVMGLSVPR